MSRRHRTRPVGKHVKASRSTAAPAAPVTDEQGRSRRLRFKGFTGKVASRIRRRPVAAVAGALAATLFAGLVAANHNDVANFGTAMLGGRGPQPTDVLAAGAVTYAAVDLDPSFSQQRGLAAMRDGLAAYGYGSNTATDLFTRIVTSTLTDDPKAWPAKWDTSWVGKRVAIAAYPPDPSASDGNRQVVAVQVTDQAAAGKALDVAKAAVTGHRLAWERHGDYLIIGTSQKAVTSVTTFPTGKTLTADPAVRADLGHTGTERIISGWADLPKVSANYPGGLNVWQQVPYIGEALFGPFGIHGNGRVAASVFADGSTLRLNAWSSALADVAATAKAAKAKQATKPTATDSRPALIRYAPKNSTFAVQVRGGGAMVMQQWDNLAAQNPWGLPQQMAQLGMTVPDAAAALVGDETMYASAPTADGTDWVVRSRSPEPDKGFQAARTLVEKVLAYRTPGKVPAVHPIDGGTIAGTTSAIVAQAGGTGNNQALGSTADFQAVLPGIDAAEAAFYATVKRGNQQAVIGGELRSGGTAEMRVLFHNMATGTGKTSGTDGSASGKGKSGPPDSKGGNEALPTAGVPINQSALPRFTDNRRALVDATKQAAALVADRQRLTESWPAQQKVPLGQVAFSMTEFLNKEVIPQFEKGEADPAKNTDTFNLTMLWAERYADQVALINWWNIHSAKWNDPAYWQQVDSKIGQLKMAATPRPDLEAAANALRTQGPKAAADIAPYVEALAAADVRELDKADVAAKALANAPVANLADVIHAAGVVDAAVS